MSVLGGKLVNLERRPYGARQMGAATRDTDNLIADITLDGLFHIIISMRLSSLLLIFTGVSSSMGAQHLRYRLRQWTKSDIAGLLNDGAVIALASVFGISPGW